MKRTIIHIFTLLLVLAVTSSPVLGKDNGKDSGKEDAKAAAEMCKKDGWKTRATEDGTPFKNQGQCNSYARQGGKLVPTDGATNATDKVLVSASTATATPDDDEPRLVIVDGTEPWNGYLEGTGFTPGETLTKVTFASDRETLSLSTPVGTEINEDGTFTTERIIYWCSEYDGYGETTGTVTVEDSSGSTYSQKFDMATHCGEKE